MKVVVQRRRVEVIRQKKVAKNKRCVNLLLLLLCLLIKISMCLSIIINLEKEEEEPEIGQGGDKQSKGSSDGDATTGSYSSLEDDEAEIDHLAALAAKYQIDNVDFGNGNKICTF